VNPYHSSPSDVRSWSAAHGLGQTANWTYETGSAKQLDAVEHAYGVSVKLDPKTRTVEHGTDIVFIDPAGRERLIGMYGTESADTAAFGHALADAAASTLPDPQVRVVGGSRSTAHLTGTEPFSLPRLDGSGTVDIAGTRRYTVLTFFSSTCTVCASELPGIEQEYRKTRGAVDYVGVDVADQASAARVLLAKTGVTYPVGVDPTGGLAARFGVTGLPYTVILDPSGHVATTHPGLLTADQLRYLIAVLPGEG
jgi:cytochrome oxidase Cu insertion factor (SCO1/SenC/PrrC family)